jgi:hypothetical protein
MTEFLLGLELEQFVEGKPHLQLLTTDRGVHVVRFPRDMGEQRSVSMDTALNREDWIMKVLGEHQKLRDRGVRVPVTRAQAAHTRFYTGDSYHMTGNGVVMISDFVSGIPLLEVESRKLDDRKRQLLHRSGTRTVVGLCIYASAAADNEEEILHDIFPPKQFMVGNLVNDAPHTDADLYMIDTEGMLAPTTDLNMLEGTANLIGDLIGTIEDVSGLEMPVARRALLSFKYGDFTAV